MLFITHNESYGPSRLTLSVKVNKIRNLINQIFLYLENSVYFDTYWCMRSFDELHNGDCCDEENMFK